MKALFSMIGLLMVLVGLLWVIQGLGYVQWPKGSFMINEIEWTYYGCGLAIVGLMVMVLARRA